MDCPLIDQNDPRCAAQLNMRHIKDVFEHCAGRFMLCPVYHELRAESLLLVAREDQPSTDYQ